MITFFLQDVDAAEEVDLERLCKIEETNTLENCVNNNDSIDNLENPVNVVNCILNLENSVNDIDCIVNQENLVNDSDCTVDQENPVNIDCIVNPENRVNDNNCILNLENPINDNHCTVNLENPVNDNDCNLENRVNDNNCIVNLENHVNDIDCNVNLENRVNDNDPIKRKTRSPSVTRTSSDDKKRKVVSNCSKDYDNDMEKIMTKKPQEDDEFDLFAKYMAGAIRNLKRKRGIYLRQEMTNLLTKAMLEEETDNDTYM